MQSTGSRAHGLSSYGSRVLDHRPVAAVHADELLCSMWDLPGPGIEPVSPALAGRFFTTEPPGKPLLFIKRGNFYSWCLSYLFLKGLNIDVVNFTDFVAFWLILRTMF